MTRQVDISLSKIPVLPWAGFHGARLQSERAGRKKFRGYISPNIMAEDIGGQSFDLISYEN
jgi:hypothetical protein